MSKKRKKRRFFLLIITLMLVVFGIVGFCQTNLIITEYTYSSTKLPEAFDGYRIVVISDLHNKNFGENQSELIEKIKSENPDMIALTGDIIDHKHKDLSSVEDLFKGLKDVAPMYYVTGNHEIDSKCKSEYESYKILMDKYGVVDLDDKSEDIYIGDSSITLTGVSYTSKVQKKIQDANINKFNILLFHASNQFDGVSTFGYDVVLSGHGHGGIIRLPFVGGVIGNDRHLWPKYEGGSYEKNGSTLFSSCGLGDSVIPRFNNPPEILVVILKTKKL